MADLMTFPDTVEEFMEQYKITDTVQIYTNGADLVPIFRMEQWFEHAADVAPRCPHYIRNIHDRGDDSLCEKWGCEVKEVQPVRHGRWETAMLAHERMGCRPTAHYCSECHQITWFRTFYCPNCGARMEESK